MNAVMVGVIVAIISTLLTFTVTTISMRGSVRTETEAAVKNHVAILHQDSLYEYVEGAILKHKQDCGASAKLEKIEKVVLAIYVKQGGNIETLDI